MLSDGNCKSGADREVSLQFAKVVGAMYSLPACDLYRFNVTGEIQDQGVVEFQ